MSLQEELDVLNSPMRGAAGRPYITLADVGEVLQELQAGIVKHWRCRV